MEVCRAFYFLTVIHIRTPINQVVEGGGFEPPKLARQIYSLIPLATREPLLKYPKGQKSLALQLRGGILLELGGLCNRLTEIFYSAQIRPFSC